ncbi:hypothetical protein VNO78_16398 [Psophocarpus tetragonolobus]|uniref:XS domain-containing protein n=1 Tax=Psophocarpus tetragonolobus TaxID=3891 RepID=A0AAN9SGS1_PSOTE
MTTHRNATLPIHFFKVMKLMFREYESHTTGLQAMGSVLKKRRECEESDTLDENDDKDVEMVQERRRKQKAKQKFLVDSSQTKKNSRFGKCKNEGRKSSSSQDLDGDLDYGCYGMALCFYDIDLKLLVMLPDELLDSEEFRTTDSSSSYTSSVELQQPTLSLLNSLFSSVTTALERAAEEKSLLLNKIRDINELSMQEVDEIINMCVRQDSVSSSDNIQKSPFKSEKQFVWPWTGIVCNIPTYSTEDERCVGESGSKLKDEYQRRENMKWIMGKKDWFANTELKSGIYAWIARAEDYKMNNIIGEQLQKMDVITISQLTEVEARMQDKLLSNLNNTLQNKRKRLKDMETKYDETAWTLWLLVVLQTEDEDMMYMYNAYLHKLITCFLSNPLARDKEVILGTKNGQLHELTKVRVVLGKVVPSQAEG